MIRPAVDSDIAFIKSSWLQSYATSDWALLCTPRDAEHTVRLPCGHVEMKAHRTRGVRVPHAGQEYYDVQKRLMDRLIANCNVSVLVLEEPMIEAFAIRDWQRPVLDFVYSRASARKQGVARTILDDLATAPEVVFTHCSRGVEWERVPKGWRFSKAEAFRYGI